MAKFKAGDLVRIVPPPAHIKYDSSLVFVDYDLVGKIGTIVKECYDPDVYVLYRFTYYMVSIFGRDALAAEFCLVLVPGMPDAVDTTREKELVHGTT